MDFRPAPALASDSGRVPISQENALRTLTLATAVLLLGGAPFASPQGEIPADVEPVVTTDSGLKYSVLSPGQPDAARPRQQDKVVVHYTGWLEKDGRKFDSSRDRGQKATFGVMQVIQGWREGLQLMPVGSRFKFTIPWQLAYGEQGQPPTIPARANLVFDVELFEIQPGPPLPVFRAPNPEAQKKTESGLKYEVLSRGAGEPPAESEAFSLGFAVWNGDGELITASMIQGQDLMGPARAMPFPFIQELAPKMKEGAHYLCEVPGALAFGNRDVPGLPAGATSIWRLEMNRILRVPEFRPSPPDKVVTTDTGLQYEVIREGTGPAPERGEPIQAHYAGWLTDGTLFDTSFSRGQPLPVRVGVGQVISGWDEGLMLMKQGAVYQFTIPWNLAYGESGRPPSIPPKADLVFYVELVQVGR